MNTPELTQPKSPPIAEALSDSEFRYAEIAALAGGLAHEIRNPLSTMTLNLELIEEDLAESETPRDRRMLKRARTVRTECRRLEMILESFLEFARAGHLEPCTCDVNATLRDFAAFFQPQAQERNVEVRLHLAASLPHVCLDEKLWRQVLFNLAGNAVDAMPNGGSLEFLTYTSPCGRSVIIEIIDTGSGMDTATRTRMFEAFYSTKPNGNGLGLPTVRKIIAAHHGTISCESAVGRGTKFRLELPISDDRPS